VRLPHIAPHLGGDVAATLRCDDVADATVKTVHTILVQLRLEDIHQLILATVRTVHVHFLSFFGEVHRPTL